MSEQAAILSTWIRHKYGRSYVGSYESSNYSSSNYNCKNSEFEIAKESSISSNSNLSDSEDDEVFNLFSDNTRRKLLKKALMAYRLIKDIVTKKSPFEDDVFFIQIRKVIDSIILYLYKTDAKFSNIEIKKSKYLIDEVGNFIKNNFDDKDIQNKTYWKEWYDVVYILYRERNEFNEIISTKTGNLEILSYFDNCFFRRMFCSPKQS